MRPTRKKEVGMEQRGGKKPASFLFMGGEKGGCPLERIGKRLPVSRKGKWKRGPGKGEGGGARGDVVESRGTGLQGQLLITENKRRKSAGGSGSKPWD